MNLLNHAKALDSAILYSIIRKKLKVNSNQIKSALLSLLKHKKYDDISMSEIIRESDVSRMGVYYNYKNKNEIMLLYEKMISGSISLG